MEATLEAQTDDKRRAWSYNGAIEAGLDPKSYSWADVPTGTWLARLDFKIWSNKTSAGCLGCYFTSLADGRQYQLSAFRPYRSTSRCYSPTDDGIDFSRPGLDGQIFQLEVGKAANGKIKWLSAKFEKDL
ncbi:hypothetical protein [Pseudomonas sp. IzPS59]|uniref:hypothetical protein n=1 Tax=Pseudomonas sp. IzPS59 TaxID=2774459 RepID=UPI001788603A|nr:hypothetical protein [Pseudomonas sp. IzPS59]